MHGGWDNETQHTARISKNFYISKHEETQGEYAACGEHDAFARKICCTDEKLKAYFSDVLYV